MPGDVNWIGPVGKVSRQVNPLAMVRAERLLIRAILGETTGCHNYAVVICQGPKPVVEEPVSVLA